MRARASTLTQFSKKHQALLWTAYRNGSAMAGQGYDYAPATGFDLQRAGVASVVRVEGECFEVRLNDAGQQMMARHDAQKAAMLPDDDERARDARLFALYTPEAQAQVWADNFARLLCALALYAEYDRRATERTLPTLMQLYKVQRARLTRAREITLKRGGLCLCCKAPMGIGERALWDAAGVLHTSPRACNKANITLMLRRSLWVSDGSPDQ